MVEFFLPLEGGRQGGREGGKAGSRLDSEGKIERLFRFCDGRGGGVDGGVKVGDGDTDVSGEACLSYLTRCLHLNFRPIDLLVRFIGIITSQ